MTNSLKLAARSSDPALVVDGAQKILAINPAAERLLGLASGAALGRTCAEVVGSILPDGNHLCAGDCPGISGFADCRPYAVAECFARRADGSRVAVEISSMAIKDDDDETGAVAVIFLHPSAAVMPEPMDGRVCLRTLGGFSASCNGVDLMVDQWSRKQALQVFKLLTARVGRPVHREELADMLWPDIDDADAVRQRLKVAVHFLRSKLREAGAPDDLVATEGSTYTLDPAGVWLDASVFEQHAAQGRAHRARGRAAEAIREYEEARRLYRGEFLEADRYADWCAEQRARLSEIHLDVLMCLATLFEGRGDLAAAAQVCHAALVVEPCREALHRALIRCLIAMGRSDRALAQYHRCTRLLREELGVAPSPETSRLVESLPAARSQITR